jgi:hypothetical protein
MGVVGMKRDPKDWPIRVIKFEDDIEYLREKGVDNIFIAEQIRNGGLALRGEDPFYFDRSFRTVRRIEGIVPVEGVNA